MTPKEADAMNAPIPEDLQTWYSVACDKVHFATDYDAIKKLIERIVALEQERDQLRAEVERLSAPVSDAEWAIDNWKESGGSMRGFIDVFIAARKTP